MKYIVINKNDGILYTVHLNDQFSYGYLTCFFTYLISIKLCESILKLDV